jgi:prepilin-type N-terminal cleavage/methylation domain-containing protein
MELPSIFSQNKKGFTLIEVLISITILTVIASLGLFISMDFYKNSSFKSENNIIVSVLQKARSRAMNNIDGKRHGVHFQTSPSVKYIIFEGSDYASRITARDQIIDASYGVATAGSSDIIFDQLSGNCLTCISTSDVIVSYGGKSYTITINNEGRIDSK